MIAGDPTRFRRRSLIWWSLAARGLFGVFGARVVRRGSGPPDGPCLVIMNHLSDCDALAVLVSARRPIRFMAKSELFEMRGVGRVLRHWGAFPVERDSADRGAIRFAADLIRGGWAVGVFPEGETKEEGTMGPLKSGVGLIARLARPEGCPVVCCALRGTNRYLPYGRLRPRFGFVRIEVSWGEPRVFAKAEAGEIPAWAEAELRRLGAP